MRTHSPRTRRPRHDVPDPACRRSDSRCGRRSTVEAPVATLPPLLPAAGRGRVQGDRGRRGRLADRPHRGAWRRAHLRRRPRRDQRRVEAMSVVINGAVSPRQPACAHGTAAATFVNVAGWFTIAVALWAGLSDAVPLWFAGLIAAAGVPAAAWAQPSQRNTSTRTTTIRTMSSSSITDVYPP